MTFHYKTFQEAAQDESTRVEYALGRMRHGEKEVHFVTNVLEGDVSLSKTWIKR